MTRKRIAQLCDKIIISGVIGLIVFTPIAIGSVHVWAFSVMELVVIGLVLTWMIKLLCLGGKSIEESLSNRLVLSEANVQDSVYKMPKSRFEFIKTPLNVPFLIFVGIVFFQIIPLPMSAIKFLSPKTYEIYSDYLPDKEDPNLKSEIQNPKSETAPLTLGGEGSVEKWRTISINPHSTRIELFKILSYTAVFFLIVNNFKTRREINYLILAIILVGCFEAVYGFYEYSTGNKNILFAPRKYHTDRLAGTYVNPNHLAGLLEMVIPIAVSFGICSLTIKGYPEETLFRAKLSLLSSRKNFTNTLLLVFVALLAGALFLSQSRMGFIGFLISIGIFGVYILRKFCKRTGLVLAIGGLSGVLCFAAWMGLNPLYKRLSTTNELSIKDRTDIWKDTGGILRDFPVFGTGKGTFVDIYPKYKTIPYEVTYDHAHNDYLELLSEVGLLGFTVTIIGGGFFIYKIIRRLTKRQNAYVKNISVGFLCGIAAIVVHSITDFNMFITANALLFSVILALLTLTAHLKGDRRQETEDRRQETPALRKPLYAFIILLAIFSSIPVLKTCMADLYYRRAKTLEESSQANIPLSIQYLQKGIALDKSNSKYHFELGRMFSQSTKTQDNPDEFERSAILAAEQFKDAIILSPCYSLAHSALGVVYNLYRTTNLSSENPFQTTNLDKLIETERSYLNKAVTLNPSSSSHNYLAGYIYVMDWNTLLREDKERALKYLMTTIELNPNYFNKALQSSWQYIQDYNLVKKIIPDTSDGYMRLAKFFDEKKVFRERSIVWEEARRREGKPFLPSIFEDDNFIVNGGFEYEPGSAWEDWRVGKVDGAVVSVDNSESVEGNNSLKILFDGTKDVDFQHVTQTIRVEGGVKCLLSGYIKTKELTSKSGIRICLYCKDMRKDTEPLLGTHDWEQFALEFDTPEDCNIVNIMCYRTGLSTVKKELISGTVWIDGLKLTPI